VLRAFLSFNGASRSCCSTRSSSTFTRSALPSACPCACAMSAAASGCGAV